MKCVKINLNLLKNSLNLSNRFYCFGRMERRSWRHHFSDKLYTGIYPEFIQHLNYNESKFYCSFPDILYTFNPIPDLLELNKDEIRKADRL